MSRMASCSLSEDGSASLLIDVEDAIIKLDQTLVSRRLQLLKSVIERFVIGDTTLLNEIVVAPVLFTFTSDLGHH